MCIEFIYDKTSCMSKSAWSRDMILPLGGRGPGFDSRSRPPILLIRQNYPIQLLPYDWAEFSLPYNTSAGQHICTLCTSLIETR